MSNTIPDDVMRAASAVVADIFPHCEMMTAGRLYAAAVPIARAILAERQRCAGVAKEHHVAHTPGFDTYDCDVSQAILNPPFSSRSSSPETTPDEIAPSQASSGTHSDWITWNGGECPVAPDTRVDVKSRRGDVSCDYRASFWDGDPSWWRHKSWNHDNDIIAYRIVPANLTQHEASL